MNPVLDPVPNGKAGQCWSVAYLIAATARRPSAAVANPIARPFDIYQRITLVWNVIVARYPFDPSPVSESP